MTIRFFFSALMRKEICHKGTKEKTATHFPLCLRVLVAKFNYCKNCLSIFKNAYQQQHTVINYKGLF